MVQGVFLVQCVLLIVMGKHMDILDGLDQSMPSDSKWVTAYNTNMERALHIANRIPLVHGLNYHNEENPDEILPDDFPIAFALTTSSEATHARENTLKSQRILQFESSLYFYAGKCFPGDLLLAYTQECEKEHEGSVTRYDTGGLVWGFIHSNLCQCDCHHDPKTNWKKDYSRCCEQCRPWVTCVDWNESNQTPVCPRDLTPLQEFVKVATIDLRDWREKFSRFLAAYYTDPDEYWFGKPARQDARQVYGNPRNQWRSRAWEVRFHEPHDADKHLLKWYAKHDVAQPLKNQMLRAADPLKRGRMKAFLDKELQGEEEQQIKKALLDPTVSGDFETLPPLNHSMIMEYWLRKWVNGSDPA